MQPHCPPSTDPAPAGYSVAITNTITYGAFHALEVLDLYQPIGAVGNRACIVFIHGGGWSGGTRSFYVALATRFAALGYVCASIDYRLATGNIWPTQINDAQLAVRWLRTNAATYNINTNRFISFGDSAGAHLSLLLGILPAIHAGDAAATYPAISPQVQCVVNQFGPADLVLMYATSNGTGTSAISGLCGGLPGAVPAVYADASPTSQSLGGTGPIYMTQGTTDAIVPPGQSLEFRAAAQQAGVSVTYISYAGGHEYGSLTQPQIDAINNGIQAFLMTQFPPS